MIEGGTAGASALAQSAQRRTVVDRLLAEANWFDVLAADEQQMAAYLAALPATYVVLHELRVPDSPGLASHLVVGPGGAFVVLTRRYPEGVVCHEGDLLAGGRSLRPELDSARIESALLTKALNTPVVPVMGLIDTPLPNATPPVVQGVLVCSVEYITRVLTRASHTTLTGAQMADAVNRALPLMTVPVTVPRNDPSATQPAAHRPSVRTGVVTPPELPPDPSPKVEEPFVARPTGVQPIAHMVPVAAVPVAEPARAAIAVLDPGSASVADAPAALPTPPDVRPPAEPVESKGRASGRFGVRRFGLIALVVLALVAAAVAGGVLVKALWSGDASGAGRPAATSAPTAGSDTTDLFTPPTKVPSMASKVPAPTVAFTASCPAAKKGWTLTPNWPGSLVGLASYEVEIRTLTGPWHRTGAFTSKDHLGAAALPGLKSGSKFVARFTAIMFDGSRSATAPAIVQVPTDPC